MKVSDKSNRPAFKIDFTAIVGTTMLTCEIGKSKGSTDGRDRGEGDREGTSEDPHLVTGWYFMVLCISIGIEELHGLLQLLI